MLGRVRLYPTVRAPTIAPTPVDATILANWPGSRSRTSRANEGISAVWATPNTDITATVAMASLAGRRSRAWR